MVGQVTPNYLTYYGLGPEWMCSIHYTNNFTYDICLLASEDVWKICQA